MDASKLPAEVKGLVFPGADEGYADLQIGTLQNVVDYQFDWIVAKDCMGVFNPLCNTSDAVRNKIYYKGRDADAPWGQMATLDRVGNIPW